jgi:hypothetical protein
MVGGVMPVKVIGRLLVGFTVIMVVAMPGGIQRGQVGKPGEF